MIALGRLGWSLRRIEQETGVRRETAGGYLKVGRDCGTATGWLGENARGKTGHAGDHRLQHRKSHPSTHQQNAISKPANEVTTDLLPDLTCP